MVHKYGALPIKGAISCSGQGRGYNILHCSVTLYVVYIHPPKGSAQGR